jgi:dihydrofolate reductase
VPYTSPPGAFAEMENLPKNHKPSGGERGRDASQNRWLFSNRTVAFYSRNAGSVRTERWLFWIGLRTKSMLDFADRLNAIPKVVFSRTLQKTEWNNTRIATTDMVEEVASFKLRSARYISLGGISISQQFIKLGLIDEYWLVVHPFVAGKGKRLFDGGCTSPL